MNPILLQKQLRDNQTDVVDYYKDLQQWGEEMKRKDESLKTGDESLQANVSTSTNKSKKSSTETKPKPDKPKLKSKKVKTFDYWEKFDADAECSRLDEENDDCDSGDLTDEFDEGAHDAALYEKEKGNKFVKNQRWDDAIECYTKAIQCFAYDPIFYANRALCHLKKQNYPAAEADCTSALQLDKTYVKAYQRRAAAREALNQLTEAHADLLKVFDYEPNNLESKTALAKLEKKLENFNKKASVQKPDTQRPKSKFTLSRQQQKGNKSSTGNDQATPLLSKNPNAARSSSEPEVPSPCNENSEIKPPKTVTYWPSGNEVEMVQAVRKPPHLRSKKPLKRINIQDIDTVNIGDEVKTKQNKNTEVAQPWPKPENDNKIIKCEELKIIERKLDDYNNDKKEDLKISSKQAKLVKEETNNKIFCDTNENVVENKKDADENQFNFVTPETSVQFNIDWRLLKHKPELRYRYLKQVNPKRFSFIFKESLDYDIFSEIVQTLAEKFIEKGIPVYDYLLGLSEVKRFSMLSMFMSENNKKDMFKLIDYMRLDSSLTNNSIGNLMSKYCM